jgi:hypothetical protein
LWRIGNWSAILISGLRRRTLMGYERWWTLMRWESYYILYWTWLIGVFF